MVSQTDHDKIKITLKVLLDEEIPQDSIFDLELKYTWSVYSQYSCTKMDMYGDSVYAGTSNVVNIGDGIIKVTDANNYYAPCNELVFYITVDYPHWTESVDDQYYLDTDGNYQIHGRWQFNEYVTNILNYTLLFDVPFTGFYDETLTEVGYKRFTTVTNMTRHLAYVLNDYIGSSHTIAVYDYGSNTWLDDRYRIIDFGSDDINVSSTFISWFTPSATPIDSQMVYTTNFDILQVEYDYNTGQSFLERIFSWLKSIPQALKNAVVSLFVPDQDQILEIKDRFILLLDTRFGAIYDSTNIVENFTKVFTFEEDDTMDQIYFRPLSVNLAGADFTFGGWNVDVVPEGFEGIIDTLKLLVNITCTFMFVNAMRKKLEALLR